MEYKLFTFPNCDKCKKVKEYLKSQKIDFEEINAGIGDGKKQFRDLYSENREKIERDSTGTMALPILLCGDEIIQGLEKILKKEF